MEGPEERDTREKWCFAGGRLSKLVTKTCQTSIKPVYYYSIALVHFLSLQDRHESATVVHIKMTKRGPSSRVTLASRIRTPISYNETTVTVLAYFRSQQSSNLSAAFWNLIRSAS